MEKEHRFLVWGKVIRKYPLPFSNHIKEQKHAKKIKNSRMHNKMIFFAQQNEMMPKQRSLCAYTQKYNLYVHYTTFAYNGSKS